MFSETRYALNGDLRVAYRASREGPRDIVFVPNWFTCCEHLPELASLQGWVEAMTSLGRLIFFDQPGTVRLIRLRRARTYSRVCPANATSSPSPRHRRRLFLNTPLSSPEPRLNWAVIDNRD